MDSLVAFSRRRRRWILLAALGTASAYGAYKIYHLPAVAARRRRLVRLAAALAAFLDAAASSADAAALVSSDLADFVRSDSDQLPRSVSQLAKLAASPEVSSTVSALSQAVAAGILRGVGSTSEPGSGEKAALSDRLVDKLFSESGERLMSAVAGSFARQLVIGFYSTPSPPGETSSSANWVNVVATGKGHKAISSWLEVLVGTAVGVFIEKTIHINTYQQLFEGLTNPSHDTKVKELLVSVCNGAVETVVKTSHHVMSRANGKLDDKGNGNSNGSGSSQAGEGWVETVSSTLAVPSNRKLVLDVTGRVTFETVRSFLEFVLWKLHDGARKSGDTMFDSGLRAMSNSATAIWLLLAGIIILHVSSAAVSLPVCAVALMTSLNGALVRAADLSGSKANFYRSWLYWPGSFPHSTFFGVPVLYENVIHLDWQQVFALPAFVVAYRFWSTPLRNEFLAVRAADVSGSKVVC